MTSIHIVSSSIRHFPDFPDFTANRLGALRGAAAAKMFYFTLIATVFTFVLILTTGAHP
jgi:hypothetical protein